MRIAGELTSAHHLDVLGSVLGSAPGSALGSAWVWKSSLFN